MKCELCGCDVERKFEVFIPVKDQPDEIIPCCGRCKILSEINDKVTPKMTFNTPKNGTPVMFDA